jgi:D-glycero-D-manno-heptose 1,7-bisphosphate phosphatase
MANGGAESRAVFLDRDGVLVPEAPPDSPPEHLEPFPWVAPAVTLLNQHGWLVIVVTNQPAVARGLRTEGQIEDQHAALGRELARRGATVDAFYFCPHHPKAAIPSYRIECDCRKPRPGMLLRGGEDSGAAMAASVMVGDRMTDIEAGNRAGCGLSILVENDVSRSPRIFTPDPPLEVAPDARVVDLAGAVDLIVSTR